MDLLSLLEMVPLSRKCCDARQEQSRKSLDIPKRIGNPVWLYGDFRTLDDGTLGDSTTRNSYTSQLRCGRLRPASAEMLLSIREGISKVLCHRDSMVLFWAHEDHDRVFEQISLIPLVSCSYKAPRLLLFRDGSSVASCQLL